MTNRQADVFVVGSGPAGLTAGIYTARAGLDTVLLAGPQPGGQMTISTEIENFPGFEEPISGPELMARMRRQAERSGVEVHTGAVETVDRTLNGYRIAADNGATITARAVILAVGATAKWLGLDGERKFLGRGVSACATCDGPFFKGEPVIVVGGGNTAVEEALHLASICKHVTLVHRRDSLRAERVMQDRLFARDNVDVVWNAEVTDIVGDGRGMSAVQLRDTTDGREWELAATGLFVAIGHQPATQAFKDIIDVDEGGYVRLPAPGSARTTAPGIFAAGDCADPIYRQAVTAAGMGCVAAIDAQKYLEAH